MFFITYIPQAAVLTLLNGPLGPINAITLVLSESGTLINFIARAWLLEDALLDVFDATLVSEGYSGLVQNAREIKPGAARNGMGKIGKLIKKPLQRFTLSSLMSTVALLPLNFIPVVGPIVFLIIQGRRSGPSYHARYFQLKSFSNVDREQFVTKHKPGYTAFGTAVMVMNLVPMAGIFFIFTSTIGAALWAAELEKGGEVERPGQTVDMAGSAKKDL